MAATLIEASKKRDFAALVPVSAAKGTQLSALLAEIRKLLPEAPPVYGPDEITDRPERFLAAELVRERIFRLLGDELPYSIAVDVENFEVEGNLRRIAVAIYVDRPGHKAIVIGEKGATLKRIGTEARHAMEALFGSQGVPREPRAREERLGRQRGGAWASSVTAEDSALRRPLGRAGPE